MKTIGDIVRDREIYFLREEQTIREAARYMTDRRVGAAAVLSGTRLVGILSERDIMGRVVARAQDPDAVAVRDAMTKDLVVALVGETHEDGLRKMKQAGCRHLPVVDGELLVGMVAQRDLMQIDLSEKDEEIRWLNAYIHLVPPGEKTA
jgi:CBS domain-containing protein